MGFGTEGPTYYDYGVGVVNLNGAISPTTMNVDYFASAQSDIDGDGTFNVWGLQVPDSSGVTAAADLLGCGAVVDAFGVAGLLGSVGGLQHRLETAGDLVALGAPIDDLDLFSPELLAGIADQRPPPSSGCRPPP